MFRDTLFLAFFHLTSFFLSFFLSLTHSCDNTFMTSLCNNVVAYIDVASLLFSSSIACSIISQHCCFKTLKRSHAMMSGKQVTQQFFS
jgi:hypothetical protein